MNLGRISVAARVAAIGVLIAVTLLGAQPRTGLPLFLVIAVGSLLNIAALSGRFRQIWVAVAEGFLVAIIAAAMYPGGEAIVPYLALPLVLGGLAQRFQGVGRVLLAEFLGILLGWYTFVEPTTNAPFRLVLTWVALGLLLGVVGAFLRSRFLGDIADASYRDAIALIKQLNALSAKLTGGLDPVALAEQMMTEADIALPVRHAVVFTPSRTGEVTPLRYSTFTMPSQFAGAEAWVQRCWNSDRPVTEGNRAAIPLRTSTGTVGCLVLDLTQAGDSRALTRLQETLSGPALQLQAALMFDDVRAQATSEERNRLAREVHDGVAQDVASLGYLVDGLAASTTNEEQSAQISELRGELTRVVAELRASVYDLRYEMRAGQGLGQGVSDFALQIGARSDLTVHVRLDEGATRLRPEVEAELLRIAQEAMNNARRHSGGDNLWVSCTVRPPHAEIEVLDDGDGLQHARPDSHGMRIMRERAESIGATLEVESLGGAPYGTRLRVRLGNVRSSPGKGS